MAEDIRVKIDNPVFKGTLNVTRAWTSIVNLICAQNGLQAVGVTVRRRTEEEMKLINQPSENRPA